MQLGRPTARPARRRSGRPSRSGWRNRSGRGWCLISITRKAPGARLPSSVADQALKSLAKIARDRARPARARACARRTRPRESARRRCRSRSTRRPCKHRSGPWCVRRLCGRRLSPARSRRSRVIPSRIPESIDGVWMIPRVHDEDVVARALGDLALVIEHERFQAAGVGRPRSWPGCCSNN